ncbi:MAG: BrnT family toxin [Candidatus Sabulitectum sp.]|nr:BrnT family toxin [Candidatus Sabulitectum sp.]
MKLIQADITGFDWNDGNRNKNLLKHNVSNGECEEIFFNQPLIIIKDKKHSRAEMRYSALGRTDSHRQLTIIYTVRGKLIRIISARDMSRKERKYYEEH